MTPCKKSNVTCVKLSNQQMSSIRTIDVVSHAKEIVSESGELPKKVKKFELRALSSTLGLKKANRIVDVQARFIERKIKIGTSIGFKEMLGGMSCII